VLTIHDQLDDPMIENVFIGDVMIPISHILARAQDSHILRMTVIMNIWIPAGCIPKPNHIIDCNDEVV